MKVVVLMPTRGRPIVWETARAMLALSTLPDTRLVVGVDNDDPIDPSLLKPEGGKLVVSTAPREDTLGAKLNRMWRDEPEGDVYALAHDSIPYLTQGWDEKLESCARLFYAGPALFNIGPYRGPLNNHGFYAMTSTMIAALGYFAPDYFPFWWVDTWVNEVAILAGQRLIHTKIETPAPPAGKKTQGIRELAWWATAFDKLRPRRVEQARRIIELAQPEPWRVIKFEQEIEAWNELLSSREAHMRDPVNARKMQYDWGGDNVPPPNARYWRAKDRMAKILEELK